MKLFIIWFSTILLYQANLYGQNKTIKGKVVIADLSYEKGVNSEFHTIPDAIIFSQDTIEIGRTNNEGIFELQIDSATNQIVVGWIGYYPELIEFSDSCEFLEIILIPDVIYDYVSPKKVERLRKKDRKIIPELYKQAYDQGIFRQEEPCR